MDMVKFFVGKEFAREKFADLLNEIGVPARVVADGIILNRGFLKEIPRYKLPVWVILNMEDINSVFHTRPSSIQEFYDIEEIG